MSGFKKFCIPFNDQSLVGDVLSFSPTPSLLMLHGGGGATRQRFALMRKTLMDKGVASCAFDFAGSGESAGVMGDSSLEDRTRQACQVIVSQGLTKPLSIIGARMGAYSAVKLLPYFPVANLILLVPAMYAAGAYRLTFNDGFSEYIRTPNSWVDSDAWEMLAQFPGRLLVVAAEKDTVIPTDVISRIMSAARKVRQKKLCIVPGAPHRILDYLSADGNQWLLPTVNAIHRML